MGFEIILIVTGSIIALIVANMIMYGLIISKSKKKLNNISK